MQREFETILQELQEIKENLNVQSKDTYLRVAEVAKLTGLSNHTIYKKTEYKQISIFRVGNKLLFKRSEVIQWIESRRVNAIAQ